MTIGQTIKTLRREQDITQEQLAEYLCVSPQAVSQWETDRTAPDISQLPALANVFGVTTDRLLGVKPSGEIKSIAERADRLYAKGDFAGAAALLEKGLREFPRSYELMAHLADALSCLGKNSEAAALCEKILAECTDSGIRESATQCLIFSHNNSGEKKEALGIVNTLPHAWSSREDMLLLLSADGEAEILKTVPEYAEFLTNRLMICLEKLSSPNLGYSEEDRIKLLRQSAAVGETVFCDGDAMYSAQFIRTAYTRLGEIYAGRRDAENLLECLENEAKYAIEFETYAKGKAHSSPAVRGLASEDYIPDGEPQTRLILKRLDGQDYDFVRESDRFKEVVRRFKSMK